MAVTAGVAVAGLLYSGYKAIHAAQQEKQARAEASNLRRPFEKVQDEFYQNQNIARELATTGLPVDTKNYLETKRNQQTGTSFEALKEAGANPNDFAKITSLYTDSLRSEAAENAQQQIANIKYFTDLNKEIAGQKTTAWAVNELQPYETKLKEIQDRNLAAQTNLNNAIDEGLGYGSALGTSLNKGNNLTTTSPATGDGVRRIGPGGNPADISPDTSNLTAPNIAPDTSTFKQLQLNT